VAGQPVRPRRHPLVPHRLPQDGTHPGAQSRRVRFGQPVARALRVDPRTPQDLVGQQVAEAREQRLVGERRLHLPAQTGKRRHEVLPRHRQRVGSDVTQRAADIGDQPKAL
jgi:hypothetical protein